MKIPNKNAGVQQKTDRVTVNLLLVSGKEELLRRVRRLSDAQCRADNDIAKPTGVAIANR